MNFMIFFEKSTMLIFHTAINFFDTKNRKIVFLTRATHSGKYTANQGVQSVEMIFQTRSNTLQNQSDIQTCNIEKF